VSPPPQQQPDAQPQPAVIPIIQPQSHPSDSPSHPTPQVQQTPQHPPSSPGYPLSHLHQVIFPPAAGKFSGDDASHWLRMLDNDFYNAGYVDGPSPSVFVRTIDSQVSKEVSHYLQANDRIKHVLHHKAEATPADVAEIKSLLKSQYPDFTQGPEFFFYEEITTLRQKESESFNTYYQRAFHVLRHTGGRDARDGVNLTKLESIILHHVVHYFIMGVCKDVVRNEAIKKSARASKSLHDAYIALEDAQRGLDFGKIDQEI
jgi:hypothetical protein